VQINADIYARDSRINALFKAQMTPEIADIAGIVQEYSNSQHP